MSNPLMGTTMYSPAATEFDGTTDVMTVEGAVNKSLILVGILIATVIASWNYSGMLAPYMIPLVLGALGIALIVVFFKKSAQFLAVPYAVMEGVVIAVVSTRFEALYPGIVIQAVGITFAVFLSMLFLYRAKIIEVTENFVSMLSAATLGIFAIYVISFIGAISGLYTVPYIHESGPVGIFFSVFVAGIAAFNLVLDFDNIEAGADMQVPKYMEWYTSFGLLVTLIWLYFEILKLLSKLRDR